MAIGTPYAACAATVTSTSTSSSDTITTNATVPQFDTLYIFVSTRLNSITAISSVTNSGGLSLSPDVLTIDGTGAQNGDGAIVRIYASVAIPSGTTFTLNYDHSPTRHELTCFGVSGVADAVPDSNHIGRSTGSGGTPAPVTAGSTPASGDLAIGIFNHIGAGANGDTGTPTSGFTEHQDGPSVGASTPFLHQYVEYKILGAGGAVTSSPSFASNSGGWLCMVAVYQPSAGGSPVTVTSPLATATAAAIVPALAAALAPSASTATAAAIVPALAIAVAPSVSTATAAGIVPALKIALAPSVSAATADAITPTLAAALAPSVAAATAAAASPGVTLILAPTVTGAAAVANAPIIIALPLLNSFDTGQSSGDTITTANSGTASDDAFTATVGTPAYSSAQAHSGTLSFLPASSASCQTRWTALTESDAYIRAYLYLQASPSANTIICGGIDNAASTIWRVAVTAAGKLTININGASAVTSTSAPTQNTWIRVEGHFSLSGGTAATEFKYFNSPESTSATETISTSGSVSSTSLASVLYGPTATNFGASPPFFDDVGMSNTGYLGPLSVDVSLSPTVAAAIASTATPVLISALAPAAATASAAAIVPVIAAALAPAIATSVADAIAPTLPSAGGITVTAIIATATAAAIAPTLAAAIAPTVASAAASAVTPALALAIIHTAAAATAAAVTPTLAASLAPVIATVAASAISPSLAVTLAPAIAAAVADATAPTISSGPIVALFTAHLAIGPTAQTITATASATHISGIAQTHTIAATAALLRLVSDPGQILVTAAAAVLITTLGYSNQVLGGATAAGAEAILGRSFHGLRQNQAYTVTGISGANGALTEYGNGRTLQYRAIQFDTLTGGWAAAANGDADSQLTTFAGNVMANPDKWNTANPFIVCWHHEATTSLDETPGSGFTSSDYKAMWAHCVALFQSLTATTSQGGPFDFAYVGWDRMFVGSGGIGPPTAGQGVDDLDPGVDLYKYLGSDVYNNLDSPGVLRYGTDATTLLRPIRDAAWARHKDWIIGEFGCPDGSTTLDHTNKAAWLDSARNYLVSLGAYGPGVCRALLMTIKDSAENFNVDSSSEAQAAFARIGAEAYFA